MAADPGTNEKLHCRVPLTRDQQPFVMSSLIKGIARGIMALLNLPELSLSWR